MKTEIATEATKAAAAFVFLRGELPPGAASPLVSRFPGILLPLRPFVSAGSPDFSRFEAAPPRRPKPGLRAAFRARRCAASLDFRKPSIP